MKHSSQEQHSHQLFSQPLILGASISKGYGTRDGGPGSVLARLNNPQAKIINKAVSGATSVQSTAHLDLESFSPSLVMGFDLFFWDVAREDCGKRFEENTKRLFKHFHDRKIPMIVGKIPVVDFPFGIRAAGLKKSAAKVNSLLEEYCHLDNNTLLFDPLDCLMSMNSDKYFSDNLHLTAEGNEYCAKFFHEAREFLKLRHAPLKAAA